MAVVVVAEDVVFVVVVVVVVDDLTSITKHDITLQRVGMAEVVPVASVMASFEKAMSI